MATEMDLDRCTALIPTCTGAKNVSEFINACDIAVSSIDKANKDLLIKIINSKLSGNALEACKYRETSTWENIKTILKGAFEYKASERALTIGLNFARMKENEDVASFAGRIEELYYKLCMASSEKLTPEEAILNKKQLKKQALIIFINGLPKHLNIALKARNPETLESAMEMAKDEELEHNANLQMEKIQVTIEKQDTAQSNNYRNQNYRQPGNNGNNNFNRNINLNRNNNFNNNPNRYNNGYNNSGFDRNNDNNFNQNNNRFNNNFRNGNTDIQQRNNNLYRYNNGQNLNNNNASSGNNSRQNYYGNNFNSNTQRNQNMVGSNSGCFICGRTNHIARNCRHAGQNQSRNTYGGQASEKIASHGNNTGGSNVPLFCEYCSKTGHVIATCFSKQRDDSRNSNNLNSQQPAVGGVRLVNQILQTPPCDAYTLSHH